MKKKLALFISLSLGLFHLFMTLSYLSPDNLLKNKFGSIVHNYMTPLFYQNWHLFSPNPGIATKKMWVRCQGENQWEEWGDPFAGILNDHYKNRLNGKGKLLRVYSNLSSGIWKHIDKWRTKCVEEKKKCTLDDFIPKLAKTKDYQLADDFSLYFCTKQKKSYSGHQFKILTFYPPKYSERDKKKLWNRVEEIVFNPKKLPITVSR